MEYDVFISYRRSDSTDRANLIRAYLTENFNPERIFLDTHEIHDGPFPDYIDNALSTAKYFVLIVSKDSFRQNNAGQTDFYIEEIKRAIAKGLKIIPVLYDGVELDKLDLPETLNSLKIQNGITAHSDDPKSLKNRLLEFTQKNNTHNLRDWIVFPLAVVSIYLVVSLIAGIGMYMYDRFFTSYDDAVEIASSHLLSKEGKFYYPIDKNLLICYNPETKVIDKIPIGASSGITINLDENSVFKIGFWSTATALVYQVMKMKYKPHNGKQYLAYLGAAVAMVAGVGLGCTIERMIFPLYQTHEIEINKDNPSFWQDVVNRKYLMTNSELYSV